jgi:uracil-DNA glycosylase
MLAVTLRMPTISAAEFIPDRKTLPVLRGAVQDCRGCGLYRDATQAVFGADYRVTKERGQFVELPWAPQATSTIHPSAILRAPDDEQRRSEYQRFVADLKKVAAGARARVKSPGI